MLYSENDLIIPTLNYLSLQRERGLKTSELIYLLSKDLEISGRDAEILHGRRDTYFSQKVRNLVSHRTLERKGLATYEKIGKDGLHKITDKGERYLVENINNFAFIINNNFNEKQRKQALDKDFLDLIIEEGFVQIGQVKAKARSRMLVAIAKKHYLFNGKISCVACNFNFHDFYGEIGRGYIEIHHLKPIYAYESKLKQSIQDALKNVVPLCSNCHSIVHRKNDPILSIPSLQNLIHLNGIYTR